MLFGWEPNVSLKSPFPIMFVDNKRSILQKKATLVYKGFLPKHSYVLHNHYSGKDKYIVYDDGFIMYQKPNIQKFFKENTKECLPLCNSNNESLIFNSYFESGNLDTVLRRGNNQYDLYLRVDSNTRGHTQWFYFSVKSQKEEQVQLRIVNLTKSNSVLSKQGKPYISYDNENWAPFAEKTEWMPSFTSEKISEAGKSHYTLKWDFTFSKEDEQVWFAYSIPYTYTK